jgi:ankyrin repeat protein
MDMQLYDAAAQGNTAEVTRLLAAGASPDTFHDYNDGATAIVRACEGGHTVIVQALLDSGANVESEDQWGNTTLKTAVMTGHIATALVLLDAGADIDAKDWVDGDTALTWASDHGHTATVQILLDAGADVDAKDSQDSTAIDLARSEGHSDVVALLEAAQCKADCAVPVAEAPLGAASAAGADKPAPVAAAACPALPTAAAVPGTGGSSGGSSSDDDDCAQVH